MKFIHVADLHFGKNFNGYSMIDEDQPYWINQFFNLVEKENPDAIVISGDVYDRGIPPKEAVNLLDYFITTLIQKNIPIFMIAGNHDSGTRLQFGSALLKKNNLYIAGEVKSEVMHITLNDKFGPVTFWLVPYLFPAVIQNLFKDQNITNYDQAMRTLLNNQPINFKERNIILSHQMVTAGGKPLDTEGSEVMVGGIGNIDISAYDGFDYVALGHIHVAQNAGKEHIRYAGSPICYHFSESKKNKKGPVIVTISEKEKPLDIRIAELPVLHPLREIKGKYSEIIEQEIISQNKNEYIKVILTDDIVPMNAVQNLSDLFEKKNSKLMETLHEPSNKFSSIQTKNQARKQSLSNTFEEFYKERFNGEYPDKMEKMIIDLIINQVENVSEDEAIDNPSENDIETIINQVIKENRSL